MSSWSWKAGLAGVAIVAATAYAAAQMPNHARMHEHMMQQGGPMMRGMQSGMHQHGMMGTETPVSPPCLDKSVRYDPRSRTHPGCRSNDRLFESKHLSATWST